MKIIIIGLGNFGSSLAEKLTSIGHEVIGVDSKMSKVEYLKEKITHTVCLDATDPQSVTHLPLSETDIVFVCIGEDEGANILVTALMKRYKVKRLIARALSSLHEAILEAMGVDEFVHPEEETAERWAKKINLLGVVDSFDVDKNHSIIEVEVPEKFIGKSLLELDFRKNYNIVVLTTIKIVEEKNKLGILIKTQKGQGVAASNTILSKGDIMVVYGNVNDLKSMLEA